MQNRGKHRYYIGNRHYSAYCHYRLLSFVPGDFTGTIAGGRHYSAGTIRKALKYCRQLGPNTPFNPAEGAARDGKKGKRGRLRVAKVSKRLTLSVLTMSPSQFPFTASERNSSMGPVSPSSFSHATTRKQKAKNPTLIFRFACSLIELYVPTCSWWLPWEIVSSSWTSLFAIFGALRTQAHQTQ